MSKKVWKDHLLSSGVPLEYSVARVFERLGSWQPGEFRYERADADGIPRVFSVDVHSSHIDTNTNFWLETLVECKYRHDGTNWVFTPHEYRSFFGPDFDDIFVTLDQCCEDRQLNRRTLADFRTHYPLCGKGIEILPSDSNPKTIEQAVQQLRFAVVAKAIDAIIHQVDGLLGSPTPLFVIVPMVVTTAELWRLKSGITVEDVRAADEIAAVADPHDLLVLWREPDNLDKGHVTDRFYETLSESQIEKLDSALKAIGKDGFDFFVDSFASFNPSLFIVVHYDRFESAVTNLHRFFAEDRLIMDRGTG